MISASLGQLKLQVPVDGARTVGELKRLIENAANHEVSTVLFLQLTHRLQLPGVTVTTIAHRTQQGQERVLPSSMQLRRFLEHEAVDDAVEARYFCKQAVRKVNHETDRQRYRLLKHH